MHLLIIVIFSRIPRALGVEDDLAIEAGPALRSSADVNRHSDEVRAAACYLLAGHSPILHGGLAQLIFWLQE